MLTAKLIYTLLLPVLVLVPATPLGNATVDAVHDFDAEPEQHLAIACSLNSAWSISATANRDNRICVLCGDPELQPIHRCTNGLPLTPTIANRDEPSIKAADKVLTNGHSGGEHKTPIALQANRWAIGNVSGREIVERITRYPSAERFPVPLLATSI